MGDIVIGRRGFLVGAGGVVVLAGCGSDGGGAVDAATSSPTPSGPVINGKDAGNVVSTEDLRQLVSRLDDLLGAGDVDGLMEALAAESYEREGWMRRVAAVRSVPLVDTHFYVTSSVDRLVNGSGGPVTFRTRLVMTHRIPDCDAHPVAQAFYAELVKPAEDEPIEVVRSSKEGDGVSPLPWDLAEIRSVAGQRATVLTRKADVGAVRRFVPIADEGTAAAMAAVPPPRGTSKVAFTLAWDRESDEETFGPSEKTIDRSAFCTYVSFVDPQQLADGTAGPDDPMDTRAVISGRVLMRRSSRESDSYFRETVCHEAVHALAAQWGTAPSWVSEGLATWVEQGYSAGVRARSYDLVRSGFPAFAAEVRGKEFDFQAEATSTRNYRCSAAIFSWVEETRGRDDAVRLARECYRADDVEDGVRRALKVSFPKVLAEVGRWVPSW